MDDDPAPCAKCCATRQTVWSPVFAAWLCPDCRRTATDDHLAEPVTALPVKP